MIPVDNQIDVNGTTRVYNDNYEIHCEDGPAIITSVGDKFWYLYGYRHRADGPACEFANGTKHWYFKGKRYTEEEYNALDKTVQFDARSDLDRRFDEMVFNYFNEEELEQLRERLNNR